MLKPKTASRTFSTTPTTAGTASPGEGKSRFFDEGRRKSELGGEGNGSVKKENESPAAQGEQKVKSKGNPIGGASAFSWLNPGK